MNQRIQELITECETEYSTSYEPGYDMEKFAELIVRECAKACEKNSYLALNGWQRAKQIREHFGVEE